MVNTSDVVKAIHGKAKGKRAAPDDSSSDKT